MVTVMSQQNHLPPLTTEQQARIRDACRNASRLIAKGECRLETAWRLIAQLRQLRGLTRYSGERPH
jgi:hypothetical protein